MSDYLKESSFPVGPVLLFWHIYILLYFETGHKRQLKIILYNSIK